MFQYLESCVLNLLGHFEQSKCNLLVLTTSQIISKRAISWYWYLSSKNSDNFRVLSLPLTMYEQV